MSEEPELPICPECKALKCINCVGVAWDYEHDEPAVCACHAAGHPR